MCAYDKIVLLKRGAAEHEYRARRERVRLFRITPAGKGIAAEARRVLISALGIWENTSIPVTAPGEALFGTRERRGAEHAPLFFIAAIPARTHARGHTL